MLNCCNRNFCGNFSYVLANRENFYRRIEFGVCPDCGVYKFLDYRLVEGSERKKILSGNKALSAFEKIYYEKMPYKQGSKSNQNFHYGDYKLTNKKDADGNSIYLQLRKNFNGEFEVLNEVKTVVMHLK